MWSIAYLRDGDAKKLKVEKGISEGLDPNQIVKK
jgi:hypothetical protein